MQKTNLDQTDPFKLCDILFVNFGCIPNNKRKLKPSETIFRNHEYYMTKQTNFFGRAFPQFLHDQYLERAFFSKFF